MKRLLPCSCARSPPSVRRLLLLRTVPPTALVLTGIVTTNDVVVSPQIGGRIDSCSSTRATRSSEGQLIAVIAPDELRAESAYSVAQRRGRRVAGRRGEAALRYQERQIDEQIRQAEANLASTEAQQAAAAADLETARLEPRAHAEPVDAGRGAGAAARQGANRVRRRAGAASTRSSGRSTRSAPRSRWRSTNAEQVAVRRSQVQANQHLQAAAAAQQAKADVRLAYTELNAPIDGIVDVRAARVGEVVTSGPADRHARSIPTTCGCAPTSRRPTSIACASATR